MRACFVCHSSRGLLGEPTGGAERQVALLALSFAARGHDVSFVVPGLLRAPRVVDGVRLLKGWERDRGVPWMRFLTYRAPRLYRVLREQRADLYYVRGRAHYAPVVMRVAHAQGGVGMLGLANDRDLLPDPARLPYDLGYGRLAGPAACAEYAYFRWAALETADWIVAQHADQAERCARMGLPHTLIPNIVCVADGMEPEPPLYDAIWVANVHREDRRRKGLGAFLELTGAEPDVRFAVAGRFQSAAAMAAADELSRRPNVEWLGELEHAAVLRAIAASKLVVNTSAWEGLSNVMLEGWALGRPTVSLAVDPNGLLSDGRLGATAGGDMGALRAHLRRLLGDDAARRAAGERAVEYVRRTHDAGVVAAAYETLVAQSGRGAGARRGAAQ